LHFAFDIVYDVFDASKCFIEDEAEILTEAEIEARNAKIK
jgi:hypothetical protein